MARRPALVIPAQVGFEVANGVFKLRFDGDVDLGWAPPGARLDIECTGDLTLALPNISGTVIAGGRLVLHGIVDADRIEGSEILLGGHDAKARAVRAQRTLRVGPAKIAFDAVIAPEVVLDDGASGRITLLDCRNELAASKVKGCLSPADYADMIGDPVAFLTARGLALLDAAPSPPVAKAAATPPPVARAPMPHAPTPPPAPPRAPTPAPPTPRASEPRVVRAPTPTPAPLRDEPDDDPPSLAVDELEPVDGGVDGQLVECVRRMKSAYGSHELPPMVADIETLVVRRDHEALRRDIQGLFQRLSEWHVKNGIRPIQAVTSAMNTIHGLVQDGERF